ncbi:MAG: hypothetical protein ACI4BI_01830, partial [Anaerotardibacter sp.]
EVRAKLSVTWSDESTDSRIDEVIIPTAEAAIRFKVGIPNSAEFSFDEPGVENMLLLAHCYYQWNEAEDEFDGNYANEIMQARIKWEVSQYVEEQETSSDL